MGLIIWNVILTMLCLHFILCIGKLTHEIEAIKSWYPFCELVKIKIDKGELKVRDDEYNFERD